MRLKPKNRQKLKTRSVYYCETLSWRLKRLNLLLHISFFHLIPSNSSSKRG